MRRTRWGINGPVYSEAARSIVCLPASEGGPDLPPVREPRSFTPRSFAWGRPGPDGSGLPLGLDVSVELMRFPVSFGRGRILNASPGLSDHRPV